MVIHLFHLMWNHYLHQHLYTFIQLGFQTGVGSNTTYSTQLITTHKFDLQKQGSSKYCVQPRDWMVKPLHMKKIDTKYVHFDEYFN